MQTQKPVTQTMTKCGDFRAKPFQIMDIYHSSEYTGIGLISVLYRMVYHWTFQCDRRKLHLLMKFKYVFSFSFDSHWLGMLKEISTKFYINCTRQSRGIMIFFMSAWNVIFLHMKMIYFFSKRYVIRLHFIKSDLLSFMRSVYSLIKTRCPALQSFSIYIK